MRILNVVGARPNFMKMAPLVRELKARGIEQTLVHTGQHYDANMSKVFFDDLGMPEPDLYLGIGSGSHAEQTAKVMVEFEKICDRLEPDLVVVVGDVNSTLACSLVAAKACIPVAHVESGLRSFDLAMPEEINRIVTDRLAEILLTPSRDGDRNLANEGVPAERIHFVGNIMIDSLFANVERARGSRAVHELGLEEGGYGVLTLHRPSNVDHPRTLTGILEAVHDVSERLPVVFSCHPRTAARLEELDGYDALRERGSVRVLAPMGYLDFIKLISASRLVMTDSGGLQEETTALGIPCLTIRENTERPITIDEGTNVLVGTSGDRIREEAARALDGSKRDARVPEFWDGRTAPRIVDVFQAWWKGRG